MIDEFDYGLRKCFHRYPGGVTFATDRLVMALRSERDTVTCEVIDHEDGLSSSETRLDPRVAVRVEEVLRHIDDVGRTNPKRTSELLEQVVFAMPSLALCDTTVLDRLHPSSSPADPAVVRSELLARIDFGTVLEARWRRRGTNVMVRYADRTLTLVRNVRGDEMLVVRDVDGVGTRSWRLLVDVGFCVVGVDEAVAAIDVAATIPGADLGALAALREDTQGLLRALPERAAVVAPQLAAIFDPTGAFAAASEDPRAVGRLPVLAWLARGGSGSPVARSHSRIALPAKSTDHWFRFGGSHASVALRYLSDMAVGTIILAVPDKGLQARPFVVPAVRAEWLAFAVIAYGQLGPTEATTLRRQIGQLLRRPWREPGR